jgi:thiamine-monophosphate kinase
VRVAFPHESLDLALTGGEDYELLFTASEEVIENVRTLADFPITVIGKMTQEGEVSLLDKEGKPFSLDKKGWEHLKQGD